MNSLESETLSKIFSTVTLTAYISAVKIEAFFVRLPLIVVAASTSPHAGQSLSLLCIFVQCSAVPDGPRNWPSLPHLLDPVFVPHYSIGIIFFFSFFFWWKNQYWPLRYFVC